MKSGKQESIVPPTSKRKRGSLNRYLPHVSYVQSVAVSIYLPLKLTGSLLSRSHPPWEEVRCRNGNTPENEAQNAECPGDAQVFNKVVGYNTHDGRAQAATTENKTHGQGLMVLEETHRSSRDRLIRNDVSYYGLCQQDICSVSESLVALTKIQRPPPRPKTRPCRKNKATTWLVVKLARTSPRPMKKPPVNAANRYPILLIILSETILKQIMKDVAIDPTNVKVVRLDPVVSTSLTCMMPQE